MKTSKNVETFKQHDKKTFKISEEKDGENNENNENKEIGDIISLSKFE